MMNKLIKFLVVFAFIGIGDATAQITIDTVYYDADWNHVMSMDSVSIIGYKHYNKNRTGKAMYYWSTGEFHSQQFEINDRKEGESKWFYKNGKLKTVGMYRDDNPIGEFLFYDSLGNYMFTTVYDELHNLRARYFIGPDSMKIYDKSDQPPAFGSFGTLEESESGLNEFLINNPLTNVSPTNQSVTVTLLITPEGKVEKVQTFEPIEESRLKAIESLVYKMPDWTPATQDGLAVYSTYPIVIKF